MRNKIAFLAMFAVFGLLLYFGSSVRAEDSTTASSPKASATPEPDDTPKPSALRFRNFFTNTESTHSPEASESPEPSETPRVRGFDRLSDFRLKFCENHHDEIDTRLTDLGGLVVNILGKFDAIAIRVEDFYTNKVKPTGKVVPNYDALVADIVAKKAAVQTALTNSQTDVQGFSCTADNPKGQIRLFRTDMQLVKKALHDYRTSIKNLIVAVKSVIGETNEESPKPSETPEATAIPVPTATPI